MTGLAGATSVAVDPANSNVCAVMGDRSVRCWGSNSDGNLGDGLAHQDATCSSWEGKCSLTPVTVAGLSDARGVAAANNMLCAWTHAGKLYCWGALANRGLGHDFSTPDAFTPIEVPNTGHVDQVVLAEYHGCLLSGGKVSCFGTNRYGAVGELPGPTGPSQTPKQVQGLPPVAQLAAWGDTVCARTDGGDVYCWGDARELITGADAVTQKCVIDKDCALLPAKISGIQNAVSLSLSALHACVLTKDKEVWCWGGNFLRGLGVERASEMCSTDFAGNGCSAKPLRVF